MKPKANPANLVITEEFVEIVSKVLKAFNGDIKKARSWIVTPNLNVGGMAPLKLFMMGRGEKVLQFINAAADEDRQPREWTVTHWKGEVPYFKVDGPDIEEGESVRVREIL